MKKDKVFLHAKKANFLEIALTKVQITNTALSKIKSNGQGTPLKM